jgi:hypothetical protein
MAWPVSTKHGSTLATHRREEHSALIGHHCPQPQIERWVEVQGIKLQREADLRLAGRIGRAGRRSFDR